MLALLDKVPLNCFSEVKIEMCKVLPNKVKSFEWRTKNLGIYIPTVPVYRIPVCGRALS